MVLRKSSNRSSAKFHRIENYLEDLAGDRFFRHRYLSTAGAAEQRVMSEDSEIAIACFNGRDSSKPLWASYLAEHVRAVMLKENTAACWTPSPGDPILSM